MATVTTTASQRHLPTGALLQDGKYRIIEVLGQGGFGITYLAEHKNFGKIAIKELFLSSGAAHCSRENTTQRQVIAHFDSHQFQDFKNRFLEEARTLYKLKDVKGVVKVIDIFEENGTVYFSMEYLDGDKLEDYVKKRNKLPEREGLRIIESVARTLSEIHRRNVLHRDIKPANIIVTRAGETFLIDFGIARSYADDVADTHTTFHSPRYSPPEQKIAKSRMGTYSDVYSLGATAYFVFTGMPPQSLEERITDDYQSPQSIVPTLSNSLNTAINDSLTIREKERIQNMDGFLNALGRPPYKNDDNFNASRPPQYSPPSDEVTKIVAKNMPQADDVTKIEPPQKPSKPIVEDDATRIMTPTPPPIQKPSVAKPIVEDDKTLLEVVPTITPTPVIEDDDKTLILGQDNNPRPQPKEPFNWKEWIKTRDGRIISISVVLSIVGIIATLLSPLVCRPKYKNLQPIPAATSDVPVVKAVDTTPQVALVAPVLEPVDTVKVAEPVVQPVKNDKSKSKKGGQTPVKTTKAPPITGNEVVPTPQTPTRVESATQPKKSNPLLPHYGKFGDIILNEDLSCKIKGEEGTYRGSGSKTPEWIELRCTTNSGKEYLVKYYIKTNTVKLE
jgi:serine/threonine protein kinase